MVALTTTTLAVLAMAIILVGWIVYGIFNVVSGRASVGSEIELAPNRKEYYDDETLEGPRLQRVQFWGVVLLFIIVVSLPLYWVLEPSRQAGAQEMPPRILRPAPGSPSPCATGSPSGRRGHRRRDKSRPLLRR